MQERLCHVAQQAKNRVVYPAPGRFKKLLTGVLATARNARQSSGPDEAGIVFDLLQARRRKGLMVDVGAHWGSVLAPFARAGWQVFCFEPDSINRKRLAYLLGNFNNVEISEMAVSDQAMKKAIFYRSEESSGISGPHRSATHFKIWPSFCRKKVTGYW